MNYPLLVILLALPMAGALSMTMVSARHARAWAFGFAVATFFVSLLLAVQLYDDVVDLKLYPSFVGTAISGVNASFHLGLDMISIWLVLLTTFLTPLAIAASFDSITERPREYYGWMLALLSAMLGVFLARDLLLFYVCFELTLVPMFFIIGIWGGPQRRAAAGKFFLFTFAGGVFTLAATIFLGVEAGTFDLAKVIHFAQHDLPAAQRWWVVLGLIAGFAVKVPIFPVHTWLPLAHTEAPTAGSVILAGVLLKLGTYGLLRLALPIGLVTVGGHAQFPQLIRVMGWLCVAGVIYGALVAWVQQDIKKLVAYSSVSHLGFCVLGLLALNDIGLQGSVLYMINHGLSTGAMFLVIGTIYDRFHTRDINQLSGLAAKMPVMAFFFVFFVLASIGLPGLNGFVSEFLTILGTFISPHLGIEFGVLAALGVILGAIYMLHMTARVIFGPLKTPEPADHGPGHGAAADPHQSHGVQYDATHAHITDLTPREIGILAPIAVAVLVLGVLPNLLIVPMQPTLSAIRTGSPEPGPVDSPAATHVAESTISHSSHPDAL